MAKKYIDSEKLIAKIKELNLVTKTYEEQVAFINALAMVVEIITSLQHEQPEFPTTDEEMKIFLATHPKVEVPDKYKTPDWLWKKQEQPDTCIFGNTPSEEACKFCGVDCELREPKQSGITSTNLSSTNEAVGLAIMAYLDTKVKHDNAKVCGVSLRVAREWIREKIAKKQEQPEVDYNKFEKLFYDFCERNKGHHITSHDACMWFWELGLKARKEE